MDQYYHSSPVVGSAEQTSAPVSPAPVNQQDSKDLNVTPQPIADQPSISRSEKVEYRDQDGNILNEEQVAALDGKVSFETRYETRTRIIDADGKEIVDEPVGNEGFAPPHPDVDREPETAADVPENDERDYPATASPDDDIGKEKSIENVDGGKPKPASEGSEATR